jgi:hypothetical protein
MGGPVEPGCRTRTLLVRSAAACRQGLGSAQPGGLEARTCRGCERPAQIIVKQASYVVGGMENKKNTEKLRLSLHTRAPGRGPPI